MIGRRPQGLLFSVSVLATAAALIAPSAVAASSARAVSAPAVSAPTVTTSTVAAVTDPPPFSRQAGVDRYDTAALVAQAAFTAGAASAVLASGASPTDALAAGYLAGRIGGPVLLTQPAGLPARTVDAIRDLGVSRVVIVGGSGAVSARVADQVAALRGPGGAPVKVTRVQGVDRYATAAAVATFLSVGQIGTVGGKRAALLSTGQGFADALAASAASAGAHLPLLLTEPQRLGADARDAIRSLGIQHVVVLGGEGAIGPAVVSTLRGLGITTTRLSGDDRVETATVLADWEIATLGFSSAQASVARGDEAGDGADALALGVLAGRVKQPVLLTRSPDSLGAALTSWLSRHPELSGGTVAGGPAALSDDLLRSLDAAAGMLTSCSNASVRVTAGRVDAGAGQRYLPLVFINVSPWPCTLHGFPGVAGLNGSGAQVDQARRDTRRESSTVTLAPGSSASALVHATAVSTGPQACGEYAGLLVTPPNLTRSTRVEVGLPECSGLEVAPVVTGSDGI